MRLSLGFAMEGFAILATDTLTFKEVTEGELLSSREYPGGKLREGQAGSYMTVSGGDWCGEALEAEPFPDFGDEDAVRDWIEPLRIPRTPWSDHLDSYLTTVFERGGTFHVRAWHEDGEITVDSTTERGPGTASLAAIFPRGIEDDDLKAKLQQSFVEDIQTALRNPDPARIIGAALNLFRRTREHTDFLGPVVDGVLLAPMGDVPGAFGAREFTHDVTEVEMAV